MKRILGRSTFRLTLARGRHFALGVLIGLSACERNGGDGEPTNGDLDAFPPVMLEEQLRLGSVDDPAVGFTRLSDYAEVIADTIWIAEQSVPEVRVYAPDGRMVRSIGRRGAGPGEMTSVSRWGIIGDTVWVYDFALTRISLFATDGSVLGTVPADGIAVSIPPYVLAIAPTELCPDGGFNGTMMRYSWPSAAVSSVWQLPPTTAEIPRVIFDKEGAARDTIGTQSMTMGPVIVPGISAERVGTLEIGPSSPLPPEQRPYSIGGDTIVVVQPAPEGGKGVLTIHRVGPTGDTLFTRVLAYRPVPVSEQFRDSIVESRVNTYRNRTSDIVGLERAVRNTTYFPEHYPPVAQVRLGADGSIWMLRTEPAADVERWFILDSDGPPRGYVQAQPKSMLLWSDGGTAVFREVDEFDIPWVIRYRMR